MLVLKVIMVSILLLSLPLQGLADNHAMPNAWKTGLKDLVDRAQSNANLQMSNARGIANKMHALGASQQIKRVEEKVKMTLGIEEIPAINSRKAFMMTPVMFVSHSMPTVTLRRYAHDLAKVGGVMVLRGGVDGLTRIKETLYFGQKILAKKKGCSERCQFVKTPLLIDPVLFQRYHIDKVPALILSKNVSEPHCNDKLLKGKINVIYGDASLRGMLEALQPSNMSSEINEMMERL